jgi:acetyltransferase-like isoleucine patch superfamily enzyme
MSGMYYFARLIKRLIPSAIKNSRIHKSAVVEAGSQILDCKMDRHSFCGFNCVIVNAEIGAFCSIADRVTIGGSEHPMHFVSTSPVFLSHRDSVKRKYSRHEFRKFPQTIIGSDVWVGYGACIKGGVKVGTGAVIGMGSVVTKDVPPYAVVAGNPAVIKKYRFTQDVITQLLSTEWWKLSDDKLQEYAIFFNSPTEFIDQFSQEKK